LLFQPIDLRQAIARSGADDPSKTRHSRHQPDRRRNRSVRSPRRRQMGAANRTRGRGNPDAVFSSGLVPAGGVWTFGGTPTGAACDRRQAGSAEIV